MVKALSFRIRSRIQFEQLDHPNYSAYPNFLFVYLFVSFLRNITFISCLKSMPGMKTKRHNGK